MTIGDGKDAGARPGRGRSSQTLKASARRRARVRRAAVPAAVRQGAGTKAAENFLAAIPLSPACIVSAYWPLGDELDSRPLLHALYQAGHGVALPVVMARGQALCFRLWRPGDGLAESSFGVLEPLPGAMAVTPDVVGAPFLACDAQGFRLGYGGGYYDRTIRALRQSVPGLLAVGLGFAAQAMAALPYDDHDEGLDWLVNERGAQQFPRQRPGPG
ncbi:MAG: 5-formyltetrahydrofolate cyclo-ligase [Alphaproteobacteria bacterium]|jgi:5-formyltetrahydrofolate cyclo-ligase|nr:5-formyltetrahydrofolate cyclo-ligase [Alphaproteobacteria bacterium]